MQYDELVTSLQQMGKDPARLIFEDELTGIPNRRFLLNYFEHKVRWEEVGATPVSLLMMDVDYFKKINDTHGHDAGDQALVQVARLMKTVSGEQWLPIRYAGDEFMILMPNGRKEEAVTLGRRLLDLVRAEPLAVGGQTKLQLTLSIGVATAPDDAQDAKTLVHRADTALYQAKQAGRNCVANVSEVQLKAVSGKAALQQLTVGAINSRGEQLAQVREAIQQFDEGQCRFVLIEGGSGMGKTTLLESVRRTLESKEAYLVRTDGSFQEHYRPYYLATNLLIALLGKRDDKGETAFASLTTEERSYLGALLPQLKAGEEFRIADDEAVKRENIFKTIVKFIHLLLDYRPLIWLVDNLHHADEASLMLAQRLLARHEVPLFVCGTRDESWDAESTESAPPLERFLADHTADPDVVKVLLKPMTPSDVAAQLRTSFPQLSAPPHLEELLARVTQGNPLFLNEILRKLVLDQKIRLVGQQWVIEPLEEKDLPKSLDEVVKQKLDALGDEGRQLIEQTSALGHEVPLSVLTGNAQAMESKVLEFIDQAASLGLLSSDYQVNDETVRFIGQRVLDVVYGNIEEPRRKELHERAGNYQEALFQKGQLPSASTLVHHYARSNNNYKAKLYGEMVASENEAVFSAQEASSYTGEAEGGTDTPLDPLSLSFVPTIVRSLQTAVRNVQRFPQNSKPVVTSFQEFAKAVQRVLAKNERLNIVQIQRSLLVNGQKATDVGEYKFVADAFRDFLEHTALRGLTFVQGVSDDELQRMVEGFAQAKPDQIGELYWHHFTEHQGITHIHLKQARVRAKAAAPSGAPPTAAGPSSADALRSEEAIFVKTLEMERPDLQAPPVPGMTTTPIARTSEPSPGAIAAEIAGLSLEQFLSNLSDRVNDVLVRGDHAQLRALLARLFGEFQTSNEATRDTLMEVAKFTFKNVPLGFQQEFVGQGADPILRALKQDLDLKTTEHLADLVHQMASAVVPFAEYRLASRLLMELTARFKHFEQANDARASVVAQVLERRLEPATQKLLADDLRASDPARQAYAAQLLGSFGPGAVPILLEVIKHEEDRRVRQLAAGMLAQVGAKAAALFKKELMLEVAAEERVRMLEVADTVTRALRTELAFALSEGSQAVREAAYGLAERLNDKRATQLVANYAGHEDPAVAAGAIKCLGKLKPAGLVHMLGGILESTKERERQVACCQALGQAADPDAIEPLMNVLTPKGFALFRKQWHADVRAAAAYALGQIDDPRAAQALAGLVNDSDPRIRQLARARLKS